MKSKFITAAFALLMLICISALCSAEDAGVGEWTDPEEWTNADAAAEFQPEPATPTDLDCPHLNVETTVYFFDSPAYTSVSAVAHRVSGAGIAETVCRDCGEVISDETMDNAEEIRPHSFKKGVCALCGYQQAAQTDVVSRDAPGERTMIAQPDGNGILFVTLTEQDLAALDKAKVKTLLIRGEPGKAAIAMDVAYFCGKVENEKISLSVEMSEQEDGSLFADLSLNTAPGKNVELDSPEGITIRFYQKQEPALRVIFAGEDQEILEADASWQTEGYWTVTYLKEGSYLLTY